MASASKSQASWARRHRGPLLLGAAALASVGAAWVYSERLKATQARLSRLLTTLAASSDAVASTADILALLAADVRAFLASDADEVPRSLVQLAKLARCPELQATLSACVSSILSGALAPAVLAGAPGEPPLVDKVIAALLSERGHSLVGLAVRSAAQHSTQAFCAAVRDGIEAALAASGGAGLAQQQHQQQAPSPVLPGSAAAGSTPGSPEQPHPQQWHSPGSALSSPGAAGRPRHAHFAQQPAQPRLPPLLASLLAAAGSPQLLATLDALIATSVGSSVGAYLRTAGSADMLGSALAALSQPANKAVVIDIMSSVSAAFCREMAAACVAPAAAVASPSRPASRLASAAGRPLLDAQQQRQQQQQGALCLESPPPPRQEQQQQPPVQRALKPFQPGAAADGAGGAGGGEQPALELDRAGGGSEGGGSDRGEEGSSSSEPSTPQSGPGTPEPSIAAAEAGGALAGSAVAGLLLRRNSLQGLAAAAGWGGGSGAPCGGPGSSGSGGLFVDPALLGPMSTLVSLFVQAARFQEFRSLMVDVSASSTREFVATLLPWGRSRSVLAATRRGAGAGAGGSSRPLMALDSPAALAALQRLYLLLAVLLLLMLYALGPKLLVEAGSLP